MSGYIGEFHSTVDPKGRFMLPAALLRQVPVREQKLFVINRGMEKHLVIYTKKEWDKTTTEINELNLYIKQNREFIRKFNRGATEVEPDGSNRLLLPKTLMEYAGIDKDIVLFAYGVRIEIWSQKEYNKMLNDDKTDFSKLAEEVMGK